MAIALTVCGHFDSQRARPGVVPEDSMSPRSARHPGDTATGCGDVISTDSAASMVTPRTLPCAPHEDQRQLEARAQRGPMADDHDVEPAVVEPCIGRDDRAVAVLPAVGNGDEERPALVIDDDGVVTVS